MWLIWRLTEERRVGEEFVVVVYREFNGPAGAPKGESETYKQYCFDLMSLMSNQINEKNSEKPWKTRRW